MVGGQPGAELTFDIRSDGKPLACFPIVNHILARPECGQRFDSLPCSLWGLHSFYEKEFSAVEQVAEHNEDAKGASHPSLRLPAAGKLGMTSPRVGRGKTAR
jgi:hypothetical protein